MTILTNKRATKKQMLEVRNNLASKFKERTALYYLENGLDTHYRKLTYIFRQGSKTLWTNTPLEYLGKLELLGIAGLIMFPD